MKLSLIINLMGSFCAVATLSGQTGNLNILYIFTDQQTAMAMSCSVNPDLNTRAMDRLANEGIRFINAYCTTPLSSPSRSAMFTGYYPHQTGILTNGMPLPEKSRKNNLGNLLSATGYNCAYAGKWHLPGNTIDETHGFKKIHNFGDKGLAESCITFLRQKHTKPFFLVASIDNPHNICEYARKQPLPWGVIEEPHEDELPNLPQNFMGAPFEPDIIRVEQMKDFTIYPVIHYTNNDWRRYRNAYYRLVEEVDKQIGLILDALHATGLDRSTIVIFSSDHGDGNAAHRWNQKSALFEEAINIPLIIRLPGNTITGKTLSHLVSNGPDLYASICDWAGIIPPKESPGISFRPLAEGKSVSPLHDYLVIETLFDRSDTRGWAVRTDRYKYVMYSLGRNREQLFDMLSDRLEMINLAIEKKHQELLKEHRQLLKVWAVRTNNITVLKYIPD